MSNSLISSFLVSDVTESLSSLTKKSEHEQFTQVAQRKRAIVIESLRLLTKKWANEWITNFFEQITHSLIFRQKTSDSLGKPMSEFPTLVAVLKVYERFFPQAFLPSIYRTIPVPAGDVPEKSSKTGRHFLWIQFISRHSVIKHSLGRWIWVDFL